MNRNWLGALSVHSALINLINASINVRLMD